MLLGLSEGQSIEWTGEDGRSHWLTVARVGAKNESESASITRF